jgi:hypothetical protein
MRTKTLNTSSNNFNQPTMTITLKELSLSNWKELLDNSYTLDSNFEDVVMFIEELLRLQKSEAVRRIDEQLNLEWEQEKEGLEIARDIIRSL